MAALASAPALHTGFATLVTLPSALVCFPAILLLSLAGCFAGTYLSKAEDMDVLKAFYIRTRPWGYWGPVLAAVRKDDPKFKPNPDFVRDMFNVVVGIIWQTSLVALPVYVVIRDYDTAKIALGVAIVTSLVLKFTWYDNLRKAYPPEQDIAPAPVAVPAPEPTAAS